ncbi:two-component system response regulator [Bacterioplanes sanyensis]|uniref:Two-component system response regulator n=1 Tax=Bacterioplanes sanyensis TaxID=1249553 RepID=A0A222FQ27_9GAMM|nr:two-component system response regulator [Bacterioplanes sanyensis]
MSVKIRNEPCILAVDDEKENLHLLASALQDDYRIVFSRDGDNAIELATRLTPDLILLDIMMPGKDGYEVAEILKSKAETAAIPIIFISAISSVEEQTLGFEHNAVDYITKPFHPDIVRARVKNHLSLVSAEELNEICLAVIHCLGHAAEYRDNETGRHVIRMAKYSETLAKAIGLPEKICSMICQAAPMHDIGKIGIPDHILRKPGKLDAEEWALMHQHPRIGYEIIGAHHSPILNMAAMIAYTHHEKWDGSGYPRGLKGTEIPLEARIVAIADVFDALTTARPYKSAWEIDRAIEFLRSQSGQHFDPGLIDPFVDNMDSILDIRQQWLEEDSELKQPVNG